MYLSLFVRDLIDLRRLPEGSSVNRWFLGTAGDLLSSVDAFLSTNEQLAYQVEMQ